MATRKKRTPNRVSRKAGSLQQPNGECESISANPDPKRSGSHHPPDLVPASHVQPKWLELATAEQRMGYDWLRQQLLDRDVEKPHINRTSKGVWECRDGNRILGRLSESSIVERSEDAVNGLFDLTSACAIELDGRELKEKHEGILWALAGAISYAQRQIVVALMRREHEEPAKRFPDKVASLIVKREKKGIDRAAVDEATYAYWVLDAGLTEWKSKQKDKRWKDLEVAGDIRAFASKQAADRFKQWRGKEQDKKCPPWFKAKSFSLPEDSLGLLKDGRDLTAMIRFQAGEQIIVKAYARGGSEWSTIRKLIGGEYKKRSARVVWDEERRKWLVRISYSYPRPKQSEGERVIAVVPSMNSLVHMFDDEARGLPKFDTVSMLIKKEQFDQRRRDIRGHLNHIGSGARGHGKKRRFRLYEDLGTKEANYTTTWNRQQAAHVVKVAQDRLASLVILDDWSTSVPCFHSDRRLEKALRRFPICSLLDAIQWACTKAGIKAVRHKCSTECPHCNASKDKVQPKRKWNSQQILRCDECGTEFDEVFVRSWRDIKEHRPEASKAFKDSADQMKRIRDKVDASDFADAAQ
jgi:transcription elongation factor Elf1